VFNDFHMIVATVVPPIEEKIFGEIIRQPLHIGKKSAILVSLEV
jgi:hypothetical protein